MIDAPRFKEIIADLSDAITGYEARITDFSQNGKNVYVPRDGYVLALRNHYRISNGLYFILEAQLPFEEEAAIRYVRYTPNHSNDARADLLAYVDSEVAAFPTILPYERFRGGNRVLSTGASRITFRFNAPSQIPELPVYFRTIAEAIR